MNPLFLSNPNFLWQLFAFRFKNLKTIWGRFFLTGAGNTIPVDRQAQRRKIEAKANGSLHHISPELNPQNSTRFLSPTFWILLPRERGTRRIWISVRVTHYILSIIERRYRVSLSKSLTLASQKVTKVEEDNRIIPITRMLSKVGFRYGTTDISRQVDDNGKSPESVVNIFCDFLTSTLGHSNPEKKMMGASKMFVSVGTRKTIGRDRTCPITGWGHRNNTQKYTIYFDTKVLMQGCWNGVC